MYTAKQILLASFAAATVAATVTVLPAAYDALTQKAPTAQKISRAQNASAIKLAVAASANFKNFDPERDMAGPNRATADWFRPFVTVPQVFETEQAAPVPAMVPAPAAVEAPAAVIKVSLPPASKPLPPAIPSYDPEHTLVFNVTAWTLTWKGQTIGEDVVSGGAGVPQFVKQTHSCVKAVEMAQLQPNVPRVDGQNDVTKENLQCIGPTPRGLYEIGALHFSTTLQRDVMTLTPIGGTHTFGRGALEIHESPKDEHGTYGCVGPRKPGTLRSIEEGRKTGRFRYLKVEA